MAKPQFASAPSSGPAGTSAPVPSFDAGPVYTPSSGPAAGLDFQSDAGRFDVNPTNPIDFMHSIEKSAQNGASLIDGLGESLFGQGTPLGSTPIGPLVQGASDLVGGVVGGAVGLAGEVITQMPSPLSAGAGGGYAQLIAMPDSPEKQAIIEQIKSDPVHALGTIDAFLRQQAQEKQDDEGSLFPDYVSATTLGGYVDNLLNDEWSPLNVQRMVAERGTSGASNRLETIMQVAAGGGVTFNDGTGLNAEEQVVVDNLKSGKWSEDQAHDYLTAHGMGFAHDAATQIGASIFLDPLTIETLGFGALAKLGTTALKTAQSGRVLEVARTIAAGDKAATAAAADRAASLFKDGTTAVDILDRAEGLVKGAKAAGVELPKRATVIRGAHAGSDSLANALVKYGDFYEKYMVGTRLGTSARAFRTALDPFATMTQRGAPAAALDRLGTEVTLTADAAFGEANVTAALWDMRELGGDSLMDAVSVAAADATGNVARTVVGNTSQQQHIAFEAAAQLERQGTPTDIVNTTLAAQPKQQFLRELTEKLVAVGKQTFTPDDDLALARRMTRTFGHGSELDWGARIGKMSTGQKQYLHLATYGRANRSILEAAAELSTKVGKKKADIIPRLVIVNKDRFAVNDAIGLVQELGMAIDQAALDAGGFASELAAKRAILEQAAARFPEIRRLLGRMLDGDVTDSDVQRVLDTMVQRIDELREEGRLPSRLTTKEIAQFRGLSPKFGDLMDSIDGSWDVGFRPEDDKLWGFSRDVQGKLVSAFEPWVDHVVDVVPNARRTQLLATNVAGMPLLGKPLSKIAGAGPVARSTDHLAAFTRTMTKRVSGVMIAEHARQRGIDRLVTKYGMDEEGAKAMWAGIHKALQLDAISPRAIREQALWEKAAHLVPYELRATGRLTSRDLIDLILRSYEGDLRMVGISQKLTGNAKTRLGKLGGNVVGYIAEDGFPTLRFRYNPVFQLQRRFDSITLLPLRGILPVLGTKLDENDLRTAALLTRMRESGLIRVIEADMIEYSKLAQYGEEVVSDMGRIKDPAWWQSITQVATAERLGYLRTIEDNLGRAIPTRFRDSGGDWDALVAHYSTLEGKGLSDGEVAVRYMLGQAHGNDVRVLDPVIRPGTQAADFKNATSAEEWLPANMGEVRPLALDRLADFLDLRHGDGKRIRDVFELKRALRPKSGARAELSWPVVEEAMRVHGMHPDYISRVHNALDFDYPDFVKELTTKFNLDATEVKQIETILDGAARVRGASPSEFLSQVFSPRVGTGRDAVVSELDATVSMLRAARSGKGSYAQLTRQLADVFIAHLDPSAREGLLRAFGNDLTGTTGLIQKTMDAGKTAESQGLNRVAEGLRGGWTPGDSDRFTEAVLSRMRKTDAEYASSGRAVTDEEYEALRQRGVDLVEGPTRSVDTQADVMGNIDAVADDLHARTALVEWGGATYSPRLNKFAEAEPWMYHGTMPSNMGGIAKAGMRPGSNWTDNAEQAAGYAFGENPPIYRAKPIDIGGQELAPGWRQGSKVKVNRMQVSRDKGQTWSPVAESGDEPGGPWSSGISETGHMSIADAQDPERFKAALRDFTQAHEQELRRQGNYIGTFRDDKVGEVQFDVVTLTFTKHDTEAVQVAYGRPGGAYDFESGNGLFKPRTQAEVAFEADVERAVQWFGKWTKETVGKAIKGGDMKTMERIVGDLSKLPSGSAIPYNQMSASVVDGLANSFKQAERDAFKLLYYARDRTWLERTVNHMFFGIYPASYMWGKVLPEIVNAVVREPFGLKTGAGIVAWHDLQMSLAAQLEYDPKLGEMLEAGRENGLAWMLMYMLPAEPWNLGAGMPPPLQKIANAALENQARVDAGRKPKEIDMWKIGVESTVDKAMPEFGQIKRTIDGIEDIVSPGTEKTTSAAPAPRVVPAPGTEDHVEATELGPLLVEAQDDLTRSLFR